MQKMQKLSDATPPILFWDTFTYLVLALWGLQCCRLKFSSQVETEKTAAAVLYWTQRDDLAPFSLIHILALRNPWRKQAWSLSSFLEQQLH